MTDRLNKGPTAKLIVDVANVDALPKNFRHTLPPHVGAVAAGHDVDLTGLVELRASASGMYAQRGLRQIKRAIDQDKIIIVDLRKETHGFVNGMAISWFGQRNHVNKDLTVDEVKELEAANLELLAAAGEITFDDWEGKAVLMGAPVCNPKVQTVAEVAAEEGFGYFRLYCLDHHRATDEEIDRFVGFVRSLSGEEWLHFHCRGGRGRATTFMIFYDMMRNAARVSLDDILKRQHIIGGRDMYSLPEGTYKYEAAVERLEVIKKFYAYCQANYANGYALTWSQWLAGDQ